MNKRIFAVILCLALAAAVSLALSGCGKLAKEDKEKVQSDRLTGVLIWASQGSEPERPEEDDISLKWVEKDGEADLQVNHPDMLAVYVKAMRKDGEVTSLLFAGDERFADIRGEGGNQNKLNAALYFDPSAELTVFPYGIYERQDGSLYASPNAGLAFGEAGGAWDINDENEDWNVGFEIDFKPFKAYEKMVVSQFDENGSCLASVSFAPEEDVKLEKAPGYAYAVCRYIRGKKSDYLLAEKDTVRRVIINPATGIGETKDIKLK